jgi:hypothetical protein
VTLGVYVTEQVATPVVAVTPRVQLVDGVKVPVEFEAKVTVPVGVLTGAVMSVTVAVHVDPWLTTTEAGEQLTVVVVLWTEMPTGRLKLLLLPV